MADSWIRPTLALFGVNDRLRGVAGPIGGGIGERVRNELGRHAA
jgi:hypothetical protein